MKNDFVAFDVETANDKRNSICSVGLVKFKNKEIIESYYSLVNPQDYFDPFNVSIHGITQKNVEDSPTFPEIKESIINFIDDLPVVAHFAQFDMGALKDAYDKYSLDYDNIRYMCSYFLAKATMPKQLSYKLNYLAKHIGVPLQHHNALSDAEASGKIINYLIDLSGHKDLDDFLSELRYKQYGLLGRRSFRRSKTTSNALDLAKHFESLKRNFNSIDVDHAYYEKYFCFTGKLESMTRKEALEKIAVVGGLYDKSVTKKTNFLVVGEQDFRVVGEKGLSSKMIKAEKYLQEGQEIEILTEDDFIKLL